MKTIVSLGRPIRRTSGRLRIPVSILTILATLGALVALWAPAYLAIFDFAGGDMSARSEVVAWSLLAIGILGFVGIFYLAWIDTHDPDWRAAHGLPRTTQSNNTAR